MTTKTRTSKITRTPNREREQYWKIDADQRHTDPELGDMRVYVSCDPRAYEYREQYHGHITYKITAQASDKLTINGRTYNHVELCASTHGGNDFTHAYATNGGAWDPGLTDAARKALKPHAERIIADYLAAHGGAEQVKKDARNRDRQNQADYLQRKIDELTKQAADILATIEK